MEGTKTFDITSGYFSTAGDLMTILVSFLKGNRFTAICSDVRAVYSRKDIVRLLIYSKFINCRSVGHMVLTDLSKIIHCGKDVLYSIKNNFKINWRSTLWNQSMDCISKLDEVDIDSTIAHQIPCLICDDSDIPKRGKFFEMIGKIFSHTGNKYRLGFKSLNLCYWTGKTSLHLDFSVHVEKRRDGNQGMTKKELKQRYSKDRPEDSHGSKRLAESLSKKTIILIQMLGRSIQKGVKARYLLVDSWFFNSNLVSYIVETSLDLITRPKKNNWKYIHNDKIYTIGELINKYKKHKARKWSRKLRMYYVEIRIEFKGHAMNLYLYKPKKRGSKWQILISTHKGLKAIKAYEIYQNRWSIEVSYKELKQHFRYGKCQSRDFVGQISDHTICLMAYNYMSMYKCINDYQSIGALFDEMKQNYISLTVMEKFWEKLHSIVRKISALFNISVDDIMEKVIYDDDFVSYFNTDKLNLTTET